MVLPSSFCVSGDFAVSICFSRYFVDGKSILSRRFADNSAMKKTEHAANHASIKNYDEPESYYETVNTEKERNAE